MKKTKLTVLFLSTLLSFSAYGQENDNLLKKYFDAQRSELLGTNSGSNFVISATDYSASMNGYVVKFSQTLNGIEVFGANGTALIKNEKISTINHNFSKITSSQNDIISKANLTEDQALLQIQRNGIRLPENATGDQIWKKKVYYPQDNTLKLSYEFGFYEPKTSNYWLIIVGATDGEILHKENLTVQCNFHDNAFDRDHDHASHVNEISKLNTSTSSAILTPDAASYNVFQFPVESPIHGNRSIAANPWILQSSPEGWHFDGTTHYTITRGNNVFAYEDMIDEDVPGFSPDGGTARNFDFPLDLSQHPSVNLSAAITNLFYACNKIHDIFYKFGFTETSKNFQKNNFALGGMQNDAVLAESQDGGGMNNANFATPPDGGSPRMQMYLWGPFNVRRVFYNAPTDAVARTPGSQPADFGPQLNLIGVTSDVAIANPIDACTPLPAGSLLNKIGLVERGNCEFNMKVMNAQNAGAKAVIVYNATTSTNFNAMGGTNSSVTIPSVLVLNSEGNFIKSKVNAGTTVNVTLKRDDALDKVNDGSYDNGIIIHEYGHGISNRNTGTGYSCLSTSSSREQMGEGWSDFFALMLTNRPGDNASVARGVGTYAVNQAISGGGIRPAKYSPNFAVNDFVYGDIASMQGTNSSGQLVTDVHSVGFVWASILWDLHWKYVEKYGYNSDVTANPNSGSARVLQLVMDGLKLQECNPTFVSGRNAILDAEMATTGGVDKCMIWSVFAKRGVGSGALAGSKTILNDLTESYALPAECSALATNEVSATSQLSVYPNPAKNEFFITFPSNTMGKAKVEVYDASGKLVMSEDKVTPSAKKAFTTDGLSNGVYVVKVKGLGIDASTKLIIRK